MVTTVSNRKLIGVKLNEQLTDNERKWITGTISVLVLRLQEAVKTHSHLTIAKSKVMSVPSKCYPEVFDCLVTERRLFDFGCISAQCELTKLATQHTECTNTLHQREPERRCLTPCNVSSRGGST